MKKLILAAIAVTCAVSAFAQGTILFKNSQSASIYSTHVYIGATAKFGNGATDFPADVTDWSAYTALSGSGYMAQLLTGTTATEASLVAQVGTVTFRTGTSAGFNKGGVTVTADNVKSDQAGFFEMVAWDDKGGTITDWATAKAAWQAGTIAAGESGIFGATFGGTGTPPPNLSPMTSFSIYVIPEPTTFALAGLGMAALLVFRRRK
jgi:hypothetical protein